MAQLTALHAARSFASDAMAHAKMVAMTPPAAALFTAIGVEGRDAGMFMLESDADIAPFLKACAELRYWPRIEG